MVVLYEVLIDGDDQGRMKKLLMRAFLTSAGVGFAFNLLQINHPPLAHGFFWPAFGGTLAAIVWY